MKARLRAAGLLAACAAGVWLSLSGAAQAADPSVDFTGGCGLLGIGSTSLPDTTSVEMTAGSRLRLVNHLGATATVQVDGLDVQTVPADQSVMLTMTAPRTASVQLAPSCPVPLVSLAGTLTVAVTAVTTPVTDPPPTASPGMPSVSPTTDPPTPPATLEAGTPATPTTAVPRTSPPAPGPATSPRRQASRPTPRPENRSSAARTVAAAVAPPVGVPGATPPTPSGPRLAANQPYIGPVTPLGADRAARYSLALVATVLILGTGLAAMRLLMSRRHVGAHRRAS